MPVWIGYPIDCFLSNSRSICLEAASGGGGEGIIITFGEANIAIHERDASTNKRTVILATLLTA
jgi:hypothetical protein